MSQPIDRRVPLSPESKLTAMTLELFSVAASPLHEQPLEAYITVQSLGEHHRVIRAYQAWRAARNQPLLIIAGANASEKHFVEMTEENLVNWFDFEKADLPKLGTQILIQQTALNTLDQAQWLTNVLQERNVRLAGFGVSSYHLLRAFCTLLAAQRRAGTLEKGLVIPRMMDVRPTDIVPETGVSFRDAISGEILKMLQYVQQDDVATYDEFMAYMKRIRDTNLCTTVW